MADRMEDCSICCRTVCKKGKLVVHNCLYAKFDWPVAHQSWDQVGSGSRLFWGVMYFGFRISLGLGLVLVLVVGLGLVFLVHLGLEVGLGLGFGLGPVPDFIHFQLLCMIVKMAKHSASEWVPTHKTGALLNLYSSEMMCISYIPYIWKLLIENRSESDLHNFEAKKPQKKSEASTVSTTVLLTVNCSCLCLIAQNVITELLWVRQCCVLQSHLLRC